MNTSQLKSTTCLFGFGVLAGAVTGIVMLYLIPPIAPGCSAAVTTGCILTMRNFWNRKFQVYASTDSRKDKG